MIQLRHVSKRFRLYDGPRQRLMAWFGMSGGARDFWALRDVTLNVPEGRTVGIVGPNGAGKSTLLKLIAGTLIPTEGSIDVQGRVAALLELGTGFHPEFTGRQNIHVNGRLLGLSSEELAAAERDIVAFSELGPFIDQPIRTYSSGMVVRLGFSIAAASRPDVLIVDEALSVGDARFSQKCIRRMKDFRESGCTILFVSHDANAVSALCDEAVLLDRGGVVSRGPAQDVLEQYGALLAAKGEGNVEMAVQWTADGRAGTDAPKRSGTFHALVAKVALLDATGRAVESVVAGEHCTIRVRIVFFGRVSNPTAGVLIRDHLGTDVFGTNTALMGMALGDFEPGESVDLDVRMPLTIGEGDYSIAVAVHRDETHLDECYDWTDRAAAFRVAAPPDKRGYGRVLLKPEWSASRAAEARTAEEALAAVFPNLPNPLLPGEVLPSPFLSGFGAVEGGEECAFRWMGGRGVFVFRPESDRVAIAVVTPPEDDGDKAVAASLACVGLGDCGRAEIQGRYAVLEFVLPENAMGVARLFELAVDRVWREAGGAQRELGLAVYAVASLKKGEPAPAWDAMTRSKSSATSSAC